MFTLKLPRQSQIHRDFLIDLDGFQSFRKTAGFTVSVSKSQYSKSQLYAADVIIIYR